MIDHGKKENRSSIAQNTSDAVAIVPCSYFAGPTDLTLLEEERANAAVARQIHDVRERAGLSQLERAKIVRTTASVISRLGNADYEGHSLAMLRRIVNALLAGGLKSASFRYTAECKTYASRMWFGEQ